MPTIQSPDKVLGQEISTANYNAERLDPQPEQELYLHLSDLRLALETVRSSAKGTLLDYGCGGSPYAGLFIEKDYKRADYLQTGHLDYLLSADSRVPEQDATFDTILSTQVLEHVEQPEVYLSECSRLLKPSGRLILTTHGTFPEHGCPYDYQRWTADGLQIALRKNSFEIVTLEKLTVGPRALFFLFDLSIRWLYAPENTLFGLGLKFLRIVLARARRWVHLNCDKHFARCRRVDAAAPGDSSFYIGLFIVARRT